jgi:hypothetical protein
MRANTPEKTGTQQFGIGTFDGDGEIRSVGGTLWWRRFDDGLSKLSAKLDKPPDMRGTAFLLIEKSNRKESIGGSGCVLAQGPSMGIA